LTVAAVAIGSSRPIPGIGGREMDVSKPTFAAYSIIGSGDSSVI
jgi:hypothetical protein